MDTGRPSGRPLAMWLLLPLFLGAVPLLMPSHSPGQGMDHDHPADEVVLPRPPSDKAFSEFSHHLAGWFVLLMSLGEFSRALALPTLRRAQPLLPLGLLGAGLYLLFWSDIDTWSLADGLIQPFVVGDWEAIQHKLYALLLLTVGLIEWRLRQGRLTGAAWRWPLPLFAIIGGALLLPHMHHVLTDVRVIELHHRIMGATAMLGGSARLLPDLRRSPSAEERARWELVWATLLLLIGIELLLYFE
jgi:putative copper resistance protein D